MTITIVAKEKTENYISVTYEDNDTDRLVELTKHTCEDFINITLLQEPPYTRSLTIEEPVLRAMLKRFKRHLKRHKREGTIQ